MLKNEECLDSLQEKFVINFNNNSMHSYSITAKVIMITSHISKVEANFVNQTYLSFNVL